MKILHVIPGLPRAGSELALLRLAIGLEKSGIGNRLVSLTGKGDLGPLFEDSGIEINTLCLAGAATLLPGLMKLRRVILEWRPDIIQTWLYAGDFAGLVAARTSTRAPVVWNVRCSNMSEHGRDRSTKLVPVLARTSNLPACVVSNSIAGKHFHQQRGYRPKRWVVIPNGVDTRAFRSDPANRGKNRGLLGIPANHRVLGVVGRLDPVKNQAAVIRAVAMAGATTNPLHIVFVGAGMDSSNLELNDLARNLGISERCIFAGQRSDMKAIYSSFDILVSASLTEGFPSVLCEAMAAGLPCITTDVGDSAIIVGSTGFIVPPGNEQALAAQISALAKMETEHLQAIGKAARVRIEHTFSADGELRAYQTLYEELTSN